MFWHKSQSSGPKIHDFCSLSARGHFFGCYNTSLTPENRGRCSSRRHDNENTAFPLAFLQHMEMWHSGRVLNDCNCKWNFFSQPHDGTSFSPAILVCCMSWNDYVSWRKYLRCFSQLHNSNKCVGVNREYLSSHSISVSFTWFQKKEIQRIAKKWWRTSPYLSRFYHRSRGFVIVQSDKILIQRSLTIYGQR